MIRQLTYTNLREIQHNHVIIKANTVMVRAKLKGWKGMGLYMLNIEQEIEHGYVFTHTHTHNSVILVSFL